MNPDVKPKGEGTPSVEELKQQLEKGEISSELLAEMSNLEIEATADFSHTLEQLRNITGEDLKPREDGYHITIVGPSEYEFLKGLEPGYVEELQAINEEIKNGQGVEIAGIGYIDTENNDLQMRKADQGKKTTFIALDIPRLNNFREKVGLPPKDFHLTLGFVKGDVHFHVTGEEPKKPGSDKMREITEPIPKKADDKFFEAVDQLPEISFGALAGTVKERRKPKVDKSAKKEKRKAKEKDGDKLRGLLQEAFEGGKLGDIPEEDLDKIVDTATSDPNTLGRLLTKNFRFVAPLLGQSEK